MIARCSINNMICVTGVSGAYPSNGVFDYPTNIPAGYKFLFGTFTYNGKEFPVVKQKTLFVTAIPSIGYSNGPVAYEIVASCPYTLYFACIS